MIDHTAELQRLEDEELERAMYEWHLEMMKKEDDSKDRRKEFWRVLRSEFKQLLVFILILASVITSLIVIVALDFNLR